MRAAILATALMFLVASEAQAAIGRSIDHYLLLKVICRYESRGSVDPEDEISHAGAVGYCQVRIITAKWLGYRGKNVDLMTNRAVNMLWGSKFLNKCLRKYGNRVYRVAFCYHGGLWLRVPRDREKLLRLKSHHYAVAVAKRYQVARFKQKEQKKKGVFYLPKTR